MFLIQVPYFPPTPTRAELEEKISKLKQQEKERTRVIALNYAARIRTETNGSVSDMMGHAEAIYEFLLKGQ